VDDASLSLLAGGGGGEEGGVVARADSIWEQRSASVAGGCSSSLAMAEQVQCGQGAMGSEADGGVKYTER
jgi:hypothetical protein